MKILTIIHLLILTLNFILCVKVTKKVNYEQSQLEKALIEENKRLKEEIFNLKYNLKSNISAEK